MFKYSCIGLCIGTFVKYNLWRKGPHKGRGAHDRQCGAGMKAHVAGADTERGLSDVLERQRELELEATARSGT